MTDANEGLEGRAEGETGGLVHGVVQGRTCVGIGVAGGKAVCGGSLGSHQG